MDPELTLDKANKIIRQRDAVRGQQEVLKNGAKGETSSIDAIRYKPHSNPSMSYTQPPRNNSSGTKGKGRTKCTRCSRGPHERSKCPAKDATCFKCSKKGHFGVVCFSSKSLASMEETEEPEGAYLDMHSSRCGYWSGSDSSIRKYILSPEGCDTGKIR